MFERGVCGLFHRPYADFGDAVQFAHEAVDVGPFLDLAVVVGVEDRGLQSLDRLDGLLHGHRIGLIDRQEGDVDVAQRPEFGSRLRVAGDVDARAADRQHVAAVLPVAGMELTAVGGGVIGRHGLDLQPVARGGDAARTHRVAIHFEHFGRGPVAEDFGIGRQQLLGCGAVQVIVVRVRDEQHVGFRERRVGGMAAHRIDVEVFFPDGDRQRGVAEKTDGELRSVTCRERVGRVFGGLRAAAAEE